MERFRRFKEIENAPGTWQPFFFGGAAPAASAGVQAAGTAAATALAAIRKTLKQFQEKCEAVFRTELLKNKEIERCRDSKKSGNALSDAPQPSWLDGPGICHGLQLHRLEGRGVFGVA